MDKEVLVSVIIPCYNADRFVHETVSSVLAQSFQSFEIIIVDDGSTDNSAEIISQIHDSRIIFLKKENTGVSDSRNIGMSYASGEFILFLDADDIIPRDFIEKRVHHLQANEQHGFCFSTILKIDESGKELTGNKIDGAGLQLLKEILSYNLNFVSCPSNYLFRKSVLQKHAIRFNIQLSSSADRYFLIELSQISNGGKITEGGHLLYRVHKNSMSNLLSLRLINDNYTFQKMVLQLDYIPKNLKRIFRFKTNYIFAGSYYKLGKYIPFTLFLFKALYYNPAGVIRKLLK
ncbi:MAG TPA: glycosyltransferase family 2 protein [Bacteroidia bacterium]|nr:glycosyltransferase family 2 protein [Bacteroidia bacterium]